MRTASLLGAFLAGGLFVAALAQVPQGVHLSRHTSFSSYRDTPEGKKLDFVVNGSTASNMDAQTILVNDFELKSFHDGNPKLVSFIAQAPECQMNRSANTAADAGPVKIFTPTTNLYVEGVGFRFTQTDHVLTISNEVRTRVVKSLVKSSILAGPRTNGAEAGGVILISSAHGHFDFTSNVVDYIGNVHMVDPQLDLTSDFLTIRFTTNGAVESLLARQNVVLTSTNNGRATGALGFYYVTNGDEIMRLTTDATWRNGGQSADAHEFVYDSTRHFLTASGRVHVRWPDQRTNAPVHATNTFRELYSEDASMQFPPTNGPVQNMHARGNVIIVNEADQSRAMADEADYQRTTDRVELIGHPVWWNNQIEVKGRTLTADLAGKTYHARNDAHFKMQTSGSSAGPGHGTNRWVYISSDVIEYQTNQALFFNNVETRVVENDKLQDKLHCSLLTLDLTNNQVKAAFATGHVRGETAPDKSGVVKTIACEKLNAYRSVQTGLIKTIDAFTNVVLEEIGQAPGAPHNTLKSDTLTAHFSPVTNQIQSAVAEHNVIFDQVKAGQKTHATADHAVYTAGADDQVRLTGSPLAHNDSYNITDADSMIWLVKSNALRAFGPYTIVPIKHAGGPKSL